MKGWVSALLIRHDLGPFWPILAPPKKKNLLPSSIIRTAGKQVLFDGGSPGGGVLEKTGWQKGLLARTELLAGPRLGG